MLYLKIEFMNWADFFNADSDAIIFGYPTLWHLDAGVHDSCTSCLVHNKIYYNTLF